MQMSKSAPLAIAICQGWLEGGGILCRMRHNLSELIRYELRKPWMTRGFVGWCLFLGLLSTLSVLKTRPHDDLVGMIAECFGRAVGVGIWLLFIRLLWRFGKAVVMWRTSLQ